MKSVAAAVMIEEGRLFLARRPPHDKLAGLWELPGGKIESGETPEECLARELVEELCMEAEVGALLARTIYQYEHGSFEMLAFRVKRHSAYELRAHDCCAWVARGSLADYRLAPADVELLRLIVDDDW